MSENSTVITSKQQVPLPVPAPEHGPQPTIPAIVVPKKPRDRRLHECFAITQEEGQGGGVRIVCKYCQDYVKILQKFNPTKARVHLTTQCTGVDEALKKTLLDSSQAAKRTSQTSDCGVAPFVLSAVGGAASITAAPSTEQLMTSSSSLLASLSAQTTRKGDSCPRAPSRVSLSFHSNNADEFLVSEYVRRYTSVWTIQ